jgi:hypothetical protein
LIGFFGAPVRPGQNRNQMVTALVSNSTTTIGDLAWARSIKDKAVAAPSGRRRRGECGRRRRCDGGRHAEDGVGDLDTPRIDVAAMDIPAIEAPKIEARASR